MLTLQKLKNVVLLSAGITLLSLIKISGIVGSAAAGFSLSHCLSPLIGLMTGGIGALVFFCIRTVVHVSMAASLPAFIFACHLPTLAAALYLSALHTQQYTITFTKKILLALIPISCMILFCIHPTGGAAAPYALFWLIPVIALFANHTHLYAHMLGSTFMAHAVGSVVWLYCGPVLAPAAWLGLMPVVVIERCLFASGMLLSYYAISALKLNIHVQKFVSLLTTTKA
jgi:hypothetical protein